MFFKVLIVCMAVSMVAGEAPLYPRLAQSANSVEYDPNPQYSFSYSVVDAHTGDNHAQEETRNGDNVHGSYSLVEADGSLRTVKYTADAVNGFNAVVEHTGGSSRSYSPPAAPVASYASPTYAAPTFAAPVAKLSAPAPQHFARQGGSSVHTSFSAPHASYQY